MRVVKNKLKLCLTMLGDKCGELKVSDEVIDSLIIAGIGAFTTLTTNYVTGADVKDLAIRTIINAGLLFFTTLGVRRGLMSKPKEAEPSSTA